MPSSAHEPLIAEPRLPRFSFEGGQQTAPVRYGVPLEGQWDEEHAVYDCLGRPEDSTAHPDTVPLRRKQLEEIVVAFNGDDDRRNPLQWTQRKKWGITLLVSLFTFVSPVSTTMVTPALPDIGDQLGIPEGYRQQLVMSIFLLGYALGPFVLGPLSELYGRGRVLQCSNLMYLIFNTACGVAQTKEQLLTFRFLAGMGGSAPQALSNGVLADMWTKETRGLGQSIYGYATWTAPCIAPIWGAFMAKSANWRWIFLSVSIFDAVLLFVSFFLLRETYAPVILTHEAAKIQKLLPASSAIVVRTEYDSKDRYSKILQKRLRLPLIMLFTHPAVQVPSLFRSYLYGTMYLVLSTFPMVFEESYGQEPLVASLHYLALMVGFFIGLEISHRAIDKLYARLKSHHSLPPGTHGPPEWRLPPLILGGILSPLGLLLYGWTAHSRTHWIAPDIGAILLGCGLIIAFQCTQAYTTDTYGARYAASAGAVAAFTRTMCGFGFPLFATSIYEALSVGGGNSLLAGLSAVLLVGAAGGLWVWGEALRRVSKRGLDGEDGRYGIGCGPGEKGGVGCLDTSFLGVWRAWRAKG
ncbi:MFS general substrate transporter [Sporormia fimetaria CBS 119925]|uniref:MFS general substrate transporter n=1 Tax=Sporormia fimetaria CBS 119925 TaxID=1340428 RepID=A0A6A6UXU4_9PLEO|nr:MFS general substrate transporter [Sporormia fimetaria CBS 119925]